MHSHGPATLPGPFTRSHTTVKQPAKPRRTTPPVEPVIPVRTELVARVRRAIADGTYDTPERWAAALNKLARSLTERK